MQLTRSAPSAASRARSTGVSGLTASPAPRPSARAASIAPRGSSHASTWNVTLSAPAAAIAEDGSTVGLGTGSTAAYVLPALARRRLRIRCVATSPATAEAARDVGLRVEPFERLERLDISVHGADQ